MDYESAVSTLVGTGNGEDPSMNQLHKCDIKTMKAFVLALLQHHVLFYGKFHHGYECVIDMNVCNRTLSTNICHEFLVLGITPYVYSGVFHLLCKSVYTDMYLHSVPESQLMSSPISM